MKSPSKIALVGAGGISCFLLPMIGRLADVVVFDADNYEPGNAARQFPALTSVGNKAEVLTSMCQPHTTQKLQFIPEYVSDVMVVNHPEWEGVGMIIGAVDNNESRRILFDLGSQLGIPVICGGNSHQHGDAFMQIPGAFDVLEHFEFPDTEPAPWHCNDEKTIEEFPQTPIANIMAAAAIMHLFLSYRTVNDPLNAMVTSRLDTMFSSSKRAREVIQETDEKASTAGV